MTRLTAFALTLSLLIVLTACSHRVPTATVEVIDTSASITPRAEKAALDAVQEQIARLGRGDSLVLIPITGDAENDAGGRILRLHAPTTREPYDADLRRFREEAGKRFTAWTDLARAEPGRTDILGALDAVAQELERFPQGTNRRVIVVSDFLEDDGRNRFTNDAALTSTSRARALAARLRAVHGLAMHGVVVCLGRLESTDYASLSPQRKKAVTAFWRAYLADGRHTPEIQVDGIGLLSGTGHCFSETR